MANSKVPRYVVWDKVSSVICPSGEIFTPAEWIKRYPVANVLKIVCAGGDVNGAYFGVFSQMVNDAESRGCDFSECETDQDYLDAIEAFEDELNALAGEPSAEERIASALEYQNLMEY